MAMQHITPTADGITFDFNFHRVVRIEVGASKQSEYHTGWGNYRTSNTRTIRLVDCNDQSVEITCFGGSKSIPVFIEDAA